jgi:hypothetical protein
VRRRLGRWEIDLWHDYAGWAFCSFGVEVGRTPPQFSRGKGGELFVHLYLGPHRVIARVLRPFDPALLRRMAEMRAQQFLPPNGHAEAP